MTKLDPADRYQDLHSWIRVAEQKDLEHVILKRSPIGMKGKELMTIVHVHPFGAPVDDPVALNLSTAVWLVVQWDMPLGLILTYMQDFIRRMDLHVNIIMKDDQSVEATPVRAWDAGSLDLMSLAAHGKGELDLRMTLANSIPHVADSTLQSHISSPERVSLIGRDMAQVVIHLHAYGLNNVVRPDLETCPLEDVRGWGRIDERMPFLVFQASETWKAYSTVKWPKEFEGFQPSQLFRPFQRVSNIKTKDHPHESCDFAAWIRKDMIGQVMMATNVDFDPGMFNCEFPPYPPCKVFKNTTLHSPGSMNDIHVVKTLIPENSLNVGAELVAKKLEEKQDATSSSSKRGPEWLDDELRPLKKAALFIHDMTNDKQVVARDADGREILIHPRPPVAVEADCPSFRPNKMEVNMTLEAWVRDHCLDTQVHNAVRKAHVVMVRGLYELELQELFVASDLLEPNVFADSLFILIRRREPLRAHLEWDSQDEKRGTHSTVKVPDKPVRMFQGTHFKNILPITTLGTTRGSDPNRGKKSLYGPMYSFTTHAAAFYACLGPFVDVTGLGLEEIQAIPLLQMLSVADVYKYFPTGSRSSGGQGVVTRENWKDEVGFAFRSEECATYVKHVDEASIGKGQYAPVPPVEFLKIPRRRMKNYAWIHQNAVRPLNFLDDGVADDVFPLDNPVDHAPVRIGIPRTPRVIPDVMVEPVVASDNTSIAASETIGSEAIVAPSEPVAVAEPKFGSQGDVLPGHETIRIEGPDTLPPPPPVVNVKAPGSCGGVAGPVKPKAPMVTSKAPLSKAGLALKPPVVPQPKAKTDSAPVVPKRAPSVSKSAGPSLPGNPAVAVDFVDDRKRDKVHERDTKPSDQVYNAQVAAVDNRTRWICRACGAMRNHSDGKMCKPVDGSRGCWALIPQDQKRFYTAWKVDQGGSSDSDSTGDPPPAPPAFVPAGSAGGARGPSSSRNQDQQRGQSKGKGPTPHDQQREGQYSERGERSREPRQRRHGYPSGSRPRAGRGSSSHRGADYHVAPTRYNAFAREATLHPGGINRSTPDYISRFSDKPDDRGYVDWWQLHPETRHMLQQVAVSYPKIYDDNHACHTIAAQPKEVRDKVFRSGLSRSANDPYAAFVGKFKGEYKSWRQRTRGSNDAWICRICCARTSVDLDVCNFCAACRWEDDIWG